MARLGIHPSRVLPCHLHPNRIARYPSLTFRLQINPILLENVWRNASLPVSVSPLLISKRPWQALDSLHTSDPFQARVPTQIFLPSFPGVQINLRLVLGEAHPSAGCQVSPSLHLRVDESAFAALRAQDRQVYLLRRNKRHQLAFCCHHIQLIFLSSSLVFEWISSSLLLVLTVMSLFLDVGYHQYEKFLTAAL